jgi:ketosteroid isomerase-like protein
MGEQENKVTVERAVELLAKQEWDGLADTFTDDFVLTWPQSGEVVLGKQNCIEIFRNYPGGSPTAELQQVRVAGDLAVAEAIFTYPDGKYHGVSIFELRDGKIARESDYFAQPFDAPEWRAQWVEKA